MNRKDFAMETGKDVRVGVLEKSGDLSYEAGFYWGPKTMFYFGENSLSYLSLLS